MSSLLQILLTVWIAGHPVTTRLPKEYSDLDQKCQRAANAIYARKKKRVRMTIECVPAWNRSA